MSFQFDTGNTGGDFDCYFSWSSNGTQDGRVQPRSFYTRDGGEKTPYDATAGFVLDFENMKSGWMAGAGVPGSAPAKVWNASVSRMEPAPQDGKEWKKAIHIPVGLAGGFHGLWEQDGAASWTAFAQLVPALSEGAAANPGLLPVVKLVDAQHRTMGKGATVVPILQIVQWVERPDSLKPKSEAPPPAPQAAMPPLAAPAPAPASINASTF